MVHIIAAKAVCFLEATEPGFRAYQEQVVANAKALAATLAAEGLRVVSGGTDTHLLLIDVFREGIKGKEAQTALEHAGITTNRNTIPFDQNTPFNPSGIRLGTPAVTTRGMKEPEMRQIGAWIARVVRHASDTALLARVNGDVRELCAAFPLYRWRT